MKESATMHGKTLHVEALTPSETTVTVLKALASEPRLRILRFLARGSHPLHDIASALDLPPSTTAAHVKVLEEAGLIHTELRAATHGLQKVCNRTYDNVVVELPWMPSLKSHSVDVAMPIGAYVACDVTPTCGLASATSLIGFLDDPLSFYEPAHVHAALIWFRSGYLEYIFPNRLPESARLRSLQLSMEICSEAPLHNHAWPSDITVWINGRELGTWTCPSDFGGRRGALTPPWWDDQDTQYGLLKRWLVDAHGAYIDGRELSRLTVADLEVDRSRLITVRLGVKPDALHVGGLNLFGQGFGNYPQDIVLRLEYTPGTRQLRRAEERSHSAT